jgi:hypothetical protein
MQEPETCWVHVGQAAWVGCSLVAMVWRFQLGVELVGHRCTVSLLAIKLLPGMMFKEMASDRDGGCVALVGLDRSKQEP